MHLILMLNTYIALFILNIIYFLFQIIFYIIPIIIYIIPNLFHKHAFINRLKLN